MFTRLDPRDDRGVAMLTVIMVMAVLAALGIAAVTVSAANLKNAGRDRFATTAQGAAEAAVSSAEAYLQTVPAKALACSTSTTTCASNPWGNSASPKQLSFPGGLTAKVWIELTQAYNPPTYKSSDYIIHSIGKSATAIGVRTIDEQVSVAPLDFPFGIYIDNKVNDQGTPGVTNESMFSKSCIDSRSKIQFQGTDPFYGIPAAAHSAQYITDANQGSCNTNLKDEQMHDIKAIHYDQTGGTQHHYCDPTYPYDQDALGGLFTDDTTYGSQCTSGTLNPPQIWSSSAFDLNTLTQTYNYSPGGLTASEYQLLKSVAQSQGNYWTHSNFNQMTWPTASSQLNPVVYLDLNAGDSVTVTSGNVASYAWDATDTTCSQVHPSIIIVVRNGDLAFGSSVAMTGAIFVPEGQITIAGGLNLVGTIFASYAKVTGSSNISLNSCYIKNIPGPLLGVTPQRFHEVDR